jgi:hypothetical protein
MARFISRLSLNQRLGGTALLLGALAVFANVTPRPVVTVHAKELLTSVERREDHVTSQELAAWIVEGRSDFERAVAVAKYFGGQPRSAAAAGAPPILALPTQAAAAVVAPPSLPGGARGGPKKRREGC